MKRTYNFTPLRIDGCKRWISASKSPRSMNGSKIIQLDDLSGEGVHLSQSVDANRATLLEDPAINGMATMVFDGVSSFMNFSSGFTDQSCTIVIVYESQEATVGASLAGSSVTPPGLYFQKTTAMQIHGVFSTSTFVTGKGVYRVMTAVFNSLADLDLYFDGHLEGSGDSTMATMLFDLVGKRYDGLYAETNIPEIIVYDHPLNSTELDTLHTGIFSYYGFTPLQFPDCVNFISPISSPITLNGDDIAQIDDLSIRQDHFTQGTPADQPELDAIGINGLPAIVSDGVSEYLAVGVTAAHTGDSFTVFYVAENITYTAGTTAASLTNISLPNDFDTATAALAGYRQSESTIRGYRNSTSLSEVTSPFEGIPYTYAVVFDGATSTSYLNGVAGTPVASTGNFNIDFLLLFSRWVSFTITQFSALKLGDIVMYSRGLSASEVRALHYYGARKYAAFTPLSISDCINYTSPISSVVELNGDGIESIEDLSVEKDDFAQGVATAQPEWDPEGINGHPAIVPDGVNDYLESTITTYTGTELTVFFVGDNQSYSQFKGAISLSGAGANDFDNAASAIVGYTTSTSFMDTFRNLAQFGRVDKPAFGTAFTYAVVFDGVNATAYLNGVAVTPEASSGSFGFYRMLLAARWASGALSQYFDIKLGDIAMYSRALDYGEITELNKYESEKYDIFNPLHIPDCMNYTSPISSKVTLNGSNIVNIEDLSPRDDDFAQGVATAQPLYDLTGINGHPAINTDGTNDYLINTIPEYTGTEFTIFFVAEHQSYGIFKTLTSFSGSGITDAGSAKYLVAGYTTSSSFLDSNRNATLGRHPRPGNGVPYTYAVTFDGTNSITYLNGVPGATVASTGNFGFYRMLLAARFEGGAPSTFLNVKLGDMIMYSRGLSGAEITQLNDYETTKYGV